MTTAEKRAELDRIEASLAHIRRNATLLVPTGTLNTLHKRKAELEASLEKQADLFAGGLDTPLFTGV